MWYICNNEWRISVVENLYEEQWTNVKAGSVITHIGENETRLLEVGGRC